MPCWKANKKWSRWNPKPLCVCQLKKKVSTTQLPIPSLQPIIHPPSQPTPHLPLPVTTLILSKFQLGTLKRQTPTNVVTLLLMTSLKPPPSQREAFTLECYSGDTNLDKHVKIYVTYVGLYTNEDVVMYKAFPTTISY